MIAIDTNVLLRYLLADHASQHQIAKKIISTRHPVLITDVVLAETIWTLTGKRYELDKAAICELVRGMIGDRAFCFENSQVIWSALMDYRDSKRIRGKALDFPDALIVRKAQRIADRDGQQLESFFSFDKALDQLEGVKVLST